jgi:hypothetical protein
MTRAGCPLHGTRLICALCDVTWTASVGERLEVEALVERSLAGLSPEEAVRLRTLLGTTLRYTFMPDPDAADYGESSHEGAHNS